MTISTRRDALIVRVTGNVIGGCITGAVGLVIGFLSLRNLGDASSVQIAVGELFMVLVILTALWLALPTTIVVSVREGLLQARFGTETVFWRTNYPSQTIQKIIAQAGNGKLMLVLKAGGQKRLLTAPSHSEALDAAGRLMDALRLAKRTEERHERREASAQEPLAKRERKAKRKKRGG